MEESYNDNDVTSRYSNLVKAFQVEGFIDEFQISGKKVTISDNDSILPYSDSGEVADRSVFFFWQTSVLIICAGVAYIAHNKLRRPRINSKQKNREKIKRKRKSKSLARESESRSPHHLMKPSREEIKETETKKESVEVCLAHNSIAPELILEKIDPFIRSGAFLHGPIINMPVERASLPNMTDALEADLVKTAQSFKTIIENSGMGGSEEMVSTLSWQAAMTLKQTAAICHATSMAEARGYIFQTQQSQLDRENSARQHDELLASIREDRSWPRRLLEARGECLNALRIATLRSLALILGFKPFVMTTGLLLRCKVHSFSGLVTEVRDLLTSCPQSRNVFTDVVGYKLQPSYLLLSYVDSYVGGASCMAANAASFSYVLLYCSAAGVVARTFGLPSFSTTLVVCLLAFSETFLSTEIMALLATVLAATAITASYIMIQFWTLRRGFTVGREHQSNQLVTASLMHFSRMTDVVQLSPLLLAISLSIGHIIFR